MDQPSRLPGRLTRWFLPVTALALPVALHAARTPIEDFMLKAETLFTGQLATSVVVVAICIAAIMNMSSKRSGGEGYGGVLLGCIILLGVQRWVAWGQ